MRRQNDPVAGQTPEAAITEIGERLADDLAADLADSVGEADDRDILRRIRAAGREAIREAREQARANSREGLESVRETLRLVREAERDAAQQVRASRAGRRPDRSRDAGEGDTRGRIQQTALALFTENGYEATSLREIAERLGVTKAALYYHFKTKDEIIESLVYDRVAMIETLLEWASEQPRTLQTRQEFVRRYSEMLHQQDHHQLMRFFERNQSSMNQQRAGVMMREKMMRMLDLLADTDAPLQDQIRCSLAIFALHSTWFTVRNPEVTEPQRREAALEVALDLIDNSSR